MIIHLYEMHLVVLILINSIKFVTSSCDVDIFFLIDSSSSTDDDFNRMKRYVLDLVPMLNVGKDKHDVAMLLYSSIQRRPVWPKLDFGVVKSNEELIEYVDTLRPVGGLTDTTAGYKEAQAMLKTRKSKAANVFMIHVTDGFPRFFTTAAAEAKRLREEFGVVMYAAAIVDPVNVLRLRNYTGYQDDRLVSYPPNVVGKTIRMIDPIVQCRSPPTTTTKLTTTTTTEDPITGCELDLCFVLDKSSSVAQVRDQFVEHMLELIDGLRLEPKYTQICLVEFASPGSAVTSFHLKKHNTKEGVAADARRPLLEGGSTSCGFFLSHSGTDAGIFMKEAMSGAADGLKKVQFELESVYYGARPNVARQIVVVMTDGNSQLSPGAQALQLVEQTAAELLVFGQSFSDDYGFGLKPNKQQLLEISSEDKVYLEPESLSRLKSYLVGVSTRCEKKNKKL